MNGAHKGMAVTFVECQHIGNNPQQLSPPKITLSFSALISLLQNNGNTPNKSTLSYELR